MNQTQTALKPSRSLLKLPDAQYYSLDQAMARMLPSAEEDTRLRQARRIMGTDVSNLSDVQLTDCLTHFNYLVDQWLDEFECQAFEGRTLKRVIGG